MRIVGTAGHVDHGKSSLVSALTGTNPDRWLEEQLRGMTLDLGFAHLQFGDGAEAGIIDVPGHERFLHNMLAGAAGMELLLLVIAATEGVMPQTVEHLQILQFLNVREIIVVATKIDLLPPEQAGEACRSIHEQLAGTIAADAPIFAVSTVTGDNLDVLREAIRMALARLPERNIDAPAYLPVDRVFALPGHGTIVTGTLMQGRIRIGDALAFQPSGRAVKVRSLQSFGTKKDLVEGGARVAVNVPAVGVHEVSRGEMLVAPQFAPSESFAVTFVPLREALPILRRRNAVRAYIGSAEILGTLVLPAVPLDVTATAAQLFLNKPTVAYPGTAYVVRRLSPKNVLGGGTVRQPAAPAAPLAGERPQEAAVLGILMAAEGALPASDVARLANLRDDGVETILAALTDRGEIARLARPVAYLHIDRASELLARILSALSDHQQQEPWAAGMTSLALSRALAMDEPFLVRLLETFAGEGRVARRAGYFSTAEFMPKLTQPQQAFFDTQIPLDSSNPFLPATLSGVVGAVKQSRIPGVGKAFDTLLVKGALVKVGDDLYRGSQIAQIHGRVEQYLRANGRMTMAQFRDLIGTSRKFAVPLLEWFDARGITVRSGDLRMLRERKPA